MPSLINQAAAADYREQIEDGAVRAMLTQAYALLLSTEHIAESDVDVLFFTRVLHDLVRDKETVRRELAGESFGDPFLGDD